MIKIDGVPVRKTPDSPEALADYLDSLDGEPNFLARVGELLDGPVVANETASRETQAPLPSTGETQGVDTSPEAVERLAAYYETIDLPTADETASTLRAIVRKCDAFKAERDEAKRENAAFWQTYSGLSKHGIFKDLIDGYRSESRLHAERDTAIARVEAAESDRGALLKVARAARDVGVFDKATVRLAQALDELRPELRAMLDHSST